jgi:hypothetical protein
MSALGRTGVDIGGCDDSGCPFGACTTAFANDLLGELPADVQFTSIYSRRDGIVQWRTCLDPHARHVEVRCSHLEMVLHPSVTSHVLRSLTHRDKAADMRGSEMSSSVFHAGAVS